MMQQPVTVEIVWLGDERLASAASLMVRGVAELQDAMRADPGPNVQRLGNEADCLNALDELRHAIQNALKAVAAYSAAMVRNNGEARSDAG